MINFEKELEKFQPSLEIDEAEEAIFNNDLTDLHDIIETIINGKEDLFAHGVEGVNSVMLANAIMLSSFKKEKVMLPIDADEYEDKLQMLVKNSKYKKVVEEGAAVDMETSFAK